NKVTLKILWETTIKKYTAPAPPGIGYVIVTTNTVVNNSLKLQSFSNYLQLQGFTVYIITENQYGAAAGQQRAINIRNWLISNYSTLNLKYVLLIGNPDPDDPGTSDSFGDIPMMMCWPNPGSTPDQTPTDYFYADLTGNWDSDTDGFYGEFGEDTVDFGPEVYVGRIPVYGNYTALDSILTKFITYTGANTSIMLPMAISNYQNEENVSNGCVTGWARTDGLNLPQQIIQNITSPLGYTDYVMYETSGVTGRGHDPVTPAAFGFKAPITNANVIAQWPNDYGIVFWWAHGNQISSSRKYWSNDANSNFAVEDGVCELTDELTWPTLLTSTDTAGLPNTETFTFQCSCYNGYPENSQNLQYSLLKQGAVATVGSTRICWYAQGTWNYTGIIDDTGIGYTYVWFLVFGQSAGEALYNGKSSLVNPWGWQGWQNLFDFNLYGDPSMYLEGPRVTPPEPPPRGDPRPPPNYSKAMCPLAHHRIEKAQDLIEEAKELLEKAETAGFDISDIEEKILEAEDILEKAKRYCLGQNCIAGNYLAIIATEMLIQAIEELREMIV
ncbi:MAG: C25 family cysteine peptidase, partial [Candidatus Methanofastidiosia archaeon]